MLGPILEFGYFPAELPDPFTARHFANAAVAGRLTASPYTWGKNGPKYLSRANRFDLARAGALRRRLAIPNPVAAYQLAKLIDGNWLDIEKHCLSSSLSLSQPEFLPSTRRAISPRSSFKYHRHRKFVDRTSSRYALLTDVSQFYSSIYTHSVPWALHSKPIAKANKSFAALLGNKLDQVIRNGQQGQTKGVPIGPDSSFLVAETILTSVDNLLTKAKVAKGIRYIDDYEFYCDSISEAEETLAAVQESLADFELDLNPRKTEIVELPAPVEKLWAAELRQFKFRLGARSQESDLKDFFHLSLELWRRYPDESVLTYAVARTESLRVYSSNWQAFESMLLQWSLAEPGVLPHSVNLLRAYKDHGYALNYDRIAETLNKIAIDNVSRLHSSEVAWALWGHLLLRMKLDSDTARRISKMKDSVVALLFLDMRDQKLVDRRISVSEWEKLMTEDELDGPNWLLAYEALVQGWLSPATGPNYIPKHPGFAPLRTHKVRFYDKTVLPKYVVPGRYLAAFKSRGYFKQ